MEELDLSYSCLLIHICWKVDSQARMKPPIHTEHLPSGAAMILIIILGPRTMIACILLMMPGQMVVPPDSIVLVLRSLQMLISYFVMKLKVIW